MAKQPKPLTRAQKILLADVEAKGDMVVHEDYSPAKALIAAGLVTGKQEKFARLRLKMVKSK